MMAFAGCPQDLRLAAKWFRSVKRLGYVEVDGVHGKEDEDFDNDIRTVRWIHVHACIVYMLPGSSS